MRTAALILAWIILHLTRAALGHPVDEVPVAGGNESCQERQEFAQRRSDVLENTEKIATHIIVPAWATMMLALLGAALLERCHVHWLPESAVTIICGAAAGAVLQGHLGREQVSESLSKFNMISLNLFFLPIIIFESGWSVRMKDFGSQIQYILVFAIIGTAICVFIVGMAIYLTRDLHPIHDLRTAFAFASLISSTDPVATLATYSSLKVEPLLNILVFGESLINDAVAIVLFEIMNTPEALSNCGGSMPGVRVILTGIAQKFCFSTAFGITIAAVAIIGVRVSRMQHSPHMLSLYMVGAAYIIYAKGEAWGMSGIIATLFAAILMNLYLKPNLPLNDELLASYFIKQLASIGDMGIFIMVGVDATLTTFKSWQFSLWVMLFCLAARGLVTGALAAAVNSCKRCSARANRHIKTIRQTRRPTMLLQELEDEESATALLTPAHIFMMWHAGLRGGIALVLCLQLGDWVDLDNGPGTRDILIETTVIIIVVFLLVFGGSTQFCLKKLGISLGMEYDDDHLSRVSVMDCTRKGFQWMDEKVLWPCLVGAGDRDAWRAKRSADTAEPNGEETQNCDEYLKQVAQRYRCAGSSMHLEDIDEDGEQCGDCGGNSDEDAGNSTDPDTA